MDKARQRVLPGGLTEHLFDAIRLNQGRRPTHVATGGVRASVLSRLLVAAEVALLPAAWLLDRQARPFVEAGIPILVADLPGFESLPPPDAPLRCVSIESGSTPGSGSFRAAWRLAVRQEVSRAAIQISGLLKAERAEALRGGRRAAVTVHLLESAERMAGRGAGYARASRGATASLTSRLVLGHLALVPFARALDRWAAPLHRRGIGLFVNDLPAIPTDAHAPDRHDR